MVRYVSLIQFTEKGAAAIGKSPFRAAAFRKAAEKAGVKVEAQYWTMGSADGLLIISAENETAALRSLASLMKDGNVRTETMLALDADQFETVSSKAGKEFSQAKLR